MNGIVTSKALKPGPGVFWTIYREAGESCERRKNIEDGTIEKATPVGFEPTPS